MAEVSIFDSLLKGVGDITSTFANRWVDAEFATEEPAVQTPQVFQQPQSIAPAQPSGQLSRDGILGVVDRAIPGVLPGISNTVLIVGAIALVAVIGIFIAVR